MFEYNLILDTDSYKYSHIYQLPDGLTHANLYIAPRNADKFAKVLMFGLQMHLKQFYVGHVITSELIKAAEPIINSHISKNNIFAFWNLLEKYKGILPIEISAVPEGTLVDTKNVLLQIRNTDPEAKPLDSAWLLGFLETNLLRGVWYPTTVATHSFYIKQIIKNYMDETCDTLDALPFKLWDFGARGTTCWQQSYTGGSGHLVSFLGTDTVPAIAAANKYYYMDIPLGVPAMEHFTVTSWGKEHEVAAYRNMIHQFAEPNKPFAIVSDSYDIKHAILNIFGNILKDQIITSGANLIVRPDSGHPVSTPVKVVEWVDEKFGSTINSKGYKVLNHLGVLQGDGIDEILLEEILYELKKRKYSTDCINFGMGGGLLQNEMNRDLTGSSQKCSEITINGELRDVFKEAPGKKSLKGKLALIYDGVKFQTIREDELNGKTDHLRPVFRDGKLLINENMELIRNRADNYLV